MKTLAFILALAAAWPVVAQTTTYKINQLTELAAAPADTDWLMIWDTSAATSKKISRANFLAGGIIPESFGLTDPGTDRLLFWDESAGVYRHLTLGTGLSISDTTLNAEAASATVTLPAARIAYGAADNTLTSEAGFEYDATFNNLRVPTMVSIGATGSAFAMYTTGSGSLTMFNDFTDETLIWNLGVGGANTAFLTSDSGVNLIDTGTIDIKVPTEVYDATGWNGDLTVPTKDAVRDKIESLSAGSAGLTAMYIGYGDGSNILTGEAAFSYNASTNTLTVDNLTVGTLNTTTLNADSFKLIETSGAGTQTLEIFAASDYTANRSLNIFTGDNDTDLTIPTAGTITMAGSTFANAWADGVKQTFNPNGTNAGVNVGSHTADPSSLENGDLWYNSTANELTARINGSNVALGAGGSSPTLAGYRQNPPIIWDEMQYNSWGTSATIGPFGWVVSAANGGSRAVSSASATDTTAPGQVQLSITTTASSASGIPSGNTILFGGGSYTFEARVQIGDLAVTTTEEYTARIGFLDSTTAEPTDGCYFRYSQADASWVAVCRSNNTETGSATDTAVDVVADTWTILTIEVNAAANSCVFKINGTTVRTETANIPSGTSRHTGLGLSLIRSAGAGTSSISMPIDYVALQVGLTSTR